MSWTVAAGSLSDGSGLYGVFDDPEAARDWAQEHLDEEHVDVLEIKDKSWVEKARAGESWGEQQ